ncbi:MAG TPA: hypothetical protein ENJ29_14030 [Bacteroidetes bacterium]|nr:hypothetical protein [Bacteroidota bacterium]
MNMQRILTRMLVVISALTLYSLQDSLSAQSNDFPSNLKNRGSLYYLGEKDELLIKVNIWGFVQKPGQYMVPNGTDLISLISFAGGPREEARLSTVKLIRNQALLAAARKQRKSYLAMNGNAQEMGVLTNQTAEKDAPEKAKQVIEIDVKKYTESGDFSLIPELRPGDTIIVEGSAFHFFAKIFEFATKLAIIAQVYFWVQQPRR